MRKQNQTSIETAKSKAHSPITEASPSIKSPFSTANKRSKNIRKENSQIQNLPLIIPGIWHLLLPIRMMFLSLSYNWTLYDELRIAR